MFYMNDMILTNHMLRLIEKAIDWNFWIPLCLLRFHLFSIFMGSKVCARR